MTIQEMNQDLRTINRIVIHPKYRAICLGERIIRETLPLVGTPSVELIAVMAKYSPFAEGAGMQKVAEQQSVEGIKRLTQTLLALGFNLQLLGSKRYVESKLENLTEEQMRTLKTAFMECKHPRFKKEVAGSRHNPYGITSDYVTHVQSADDLQIGRLIKILAMLSQTKVYLIWKGNSKNDF
jgi:hypothetical protein